MICVNPACKRDVATLRPRGLCDRCYDNMAIRMLFPNLPKKKPVDSHREPSAAEVDELVQQQAANLPEWWREKKKS